jgi:hypothetical protein
VLVHDHHDHHDQEHATVAGCDTRHTTSTITRPTACGSPRRGSQHLREMLSRTTAYVDILDSVIHAMLRIPAVRYPSRPRVPRRSCFDDAWDCDANALRFGSSLVPVWK